MAIPPWKVPTDVNNVVQQVKALHHPHLEDAVIAVAFDDSKPFKNERLNWGKTQRFSDLNKLFQAPQALDFCIILSSDVWHDVLDADQKEALVDLHLTRCQLNMCLKQLLRMARKKQLKMNLVGLNTPMKLNSMTAETPNGK